MQNVNTVITALESCREKSHAEFQLLFKRAENLGNLSGTPISIPRLEKRQTCRPAGPSSSAEDYFRQCLYLPLLKHFTSDLKERFSPAAQNVFALQGLIPAYLNSYTDEDLMNAALVYEDDLECLSVSQIKTELTLWRAKWKHSKASPHCIVIFVLFLLPSN